MKAFALSWIEKRFALSVGRRLCETLSVVARACCGSDGFSKGWDRKRPAFKYFCSFHGNRGLLEGRGLMLDLLLEVWVHMSPSGFGT